MQVLINYENKKPYCIKT